MYQRILRDPLLFPPDMSHDAKSVMTGLLQRDPSMRLGHNGADEIKRHPFFARHVDWKMLLAKKIQPPFKPSVVRLPFLPPPPTKTYYAFVIEHITLTLMRFVYLF